MDDDFVLLLLFGFVVWWILREQPASAIVVPGGASAATAAASLNLGGPIPGAAATGSTPNLIQSLEGSASSVTHVPLGAVGSAAQKAPTWLKLAVFPIGLTAVTQDLINNPKGAAKAVGRFAETGAKDVAGVSVKVAKTVVRAPVVLAKDATRAVGNTAAKVGGAAKSAAKSVVHAISSLNPF